MRWNKIVVIAIVIVSMCCCFTTLRRLLQLNALLIETSSFDNNGAPLTAPIRTIASDDDNNNPGLCRHLDTIGDDPSSSSSSSSSSRRHHFHLFNHLRAQLLNRTLDRLEGLFSSGLLRDDWTDLVAQLWQRPHHRVRRALVNPIRPDLAKRLLHIAERRLADPARHPPLHILVLGGSIALGNGAGFSPKHGIKANDTQARWSSQFQDLLTSTTILLGRDDVVRVTNMANGGMTTDVSSIPIQYGLYPPPGPDLIIASFGYNDMAMMLAKHKNPYLYQMDETQQYMYLLNATQRLVRAAGTIPLLLLDDSFMIPTIPIRQNLLHSRALSEVTTWFDVWSVSWTKAFLHVSYSDPSLQNVSEETDIYWPLWGGNLKTAHPNIFFHTGMAWMLFYQFVLMLQDACADSAIAPDASAEAPLLTNKTTTFTQLDTHYIPLIDSHTHFQELSAAWWNATKQTEHSYNKTKMSSSSICSYAWIANRATNIQTSQDVKRMVESVLLTNRGWIEEGNPVRKPRPGWVATTPKAVFDIRVNATHHPIRSMKLLYMKSYGTKWQHSKLGITLKVRREINDNSTKATTTTKTTTLMKKKLELVGYHSSNTSVNYEATMNDLVATIGDYVWVKFAVVGGSTFRINGMLFCAQ